MQLLKGGGETNFSKSTDPCLKNAGVNTSKFQTHSVVAGTSKAFLSGLTVEDILKAAS